MTAQSMPHRERARTQVGGNVEQQPRHCLDERKASQEVLLRHPTGAHDLILQQRQHHLGTRDHFIVMACAAPRVPCA